MTGKPKPLEADVFRVIALAIFLFHAAGALALDLVRIDTSADLAYADYGVSGKGVTIAILDTGIAWDHPDFSNENGVTRIRWMLDLSGQNGCDADNPEPVEYSSSEINQALASGVGLAMRDASGH